MAVGDTVSGLSAANLTFQPAAGVEVMITSIGGANDANFGSNLTNGALYSAQLYGTAARNTYTTKIFLTNTNYMRIDAAAETRGFTGITIK